MIGQMRFCLRKASGVSLGQGLPATLPVVDDVEKIVDTDEAVAIRILFADS